MSNESTASMQCANKIMDLFEKPSRRVTADEVRDLIDASTGLPQLIAERDRLAKVREVLDKSYGADETLSDRLDAIAEIAAGPTAAPKQ